MNLKKLCRNILVCGDTNQRWHDVVRHQTSANICLVILLDMQELLCHYHVCYDYVFTGIVINFYTISPGSFILSRAHETRLIIAILLTCRTAGNTKGSKFLEYNFLDVYLVNPVIFTTESEAFGFVFLGIFAIFEIGCMENPEHRISRNRQIFASATESQITNLL